MENDTMNIINEIYNFKKQTDGIQHYAFHEIKCFCERSLISYKELFSAEFNIERYFKLFAHLWNKLSNKERIDEFKIYCNRDLNHGSMQNKEIEIWRYTDSKAHFYKLKVSKKCEIYDKFLNSSLLRNLAKTIVQFIHDQKAATVKYKLFNKYYSALLNENVLVIENENNGLIAKFHAKFIKNDGLSDAAKELRKYIVKNLVKRLTHKTSFTIHKRFLDHEDDSILHLPDENFDELYDAFFDAFKFEFINDDIDEVIRKSVTKHSIRITDDVDLTSLKEEIYSFLNDPIAVKGCIFQLLNNKTSKCTVRKKLLKDIEPAEVNIELEQQVFTEFEQYLCNFQSQRIMLFLTDHNLLSTLKVKKFTDKYTSDAEKSIFISAENFLKSTDDVVGLLKCSSTKFLIIQWDKNTDKNQAYGALKMLEPAVTEGKYVIIISNGNTIDELDYDFNQLIYDHGLIGLTTKSQNDILNFENVYLHGQSIRITDLADGEEALEIIKYPKILEDILYRKLVVGKDPKKPDGFKEKFFDFQHLKHVNEIKTTQDVLNDRCKIVIISGRSGIGKSVYLYNLSERLRASSNSLWILQLNLNDVLLRQYASDQSCNYESFIKTAVGLDKACQKLFDIAMAGKLKIKVVLFIDGNDELRQEKSISFVQRLLKHLQSSLIYKIYIASNSKILETTLGIYAYSLSFSEAEKEQYVQKYPNINQSDILENDTYRTFTDTPLHLKMLLDLSEGNRDLRSLKNMQDLYRDYVKFKMTDGNKLESAYQISIKEILNEEELLSLDADLNMDIEEPEELFHNSFTEYFAAEWLLRKSEVGPDVKYNVFKCVDRLVEYMSPIFINTLIHRHMDNPLTLNSLLEELIQKGHFNFLKCVLSLKKTKKPLLRYVIESTHANALITLNYILEYYNDTDDTEIVKHGELKRTEYIDSKIAKYVNEPIRDETPLQTANRVRRIDLASELMLKGADISKVNANFVDDIADFVIDQTIKGNDRYGPIVEKLLMPSSNAVQKLKKDNYYHTFLVDCFVRGRIQLVKMFLKDDPNRCTLLKTKMGDKLILDYVNESEYLNDSERCEIVKYILNNVEEDLYIGSVLDAACKYEHTQTFDYFVNQYPGGCAGYLNQAMSKNECNIIQFLMVNMRDKTIDENGNTALHRAITLGISPITIKLLIEKGGINDRNAAGKTALCLAFENGADLDFIKYLIDRKASLSVEDKTGLYPWCYCILATSRYSKEEQIELMRYLLKKRIKAPERSGINLESDRKREEIIQKLEYFRKLDSWNNEILAKRLHDALKEPNKDNWCSFLIIHGADLSVKDDHGKTPLHIALEFKRYEVALLMLQFGAMFDVADKKNLSPLRLLKEAKNTEEKHKEIIALLELAGVLFTDPDKWDDFTSGDWDNVETSRLRYLINCRNSQRTTLLHAATFVDTKKSTNTTKKLYEFSKKCCQKFPSIPVLDVNAGDAENETPLDIAIGRNSIDVIRQLFEIGASYESIGSNSSNALVSDAKQLFKAVKMDNLKKVAELSKNEYLINARDKAGRCVLHYATTDQAMQLLIRPKFVNAIDNKRKSPLHLAVKNDRLDCAILLLENGASYDLKDQRGSTPFGRKRTGNRARKMLKMIDELFKDIQSDDPQILSCKDPDTLTKHLSTAEQNYGIKPDVIANVKDRKKNTLLHYARRFNYLSIEMNLIQHGAKNIENPEINEDK